MFVHHSRQFLTSVDLCMYVCMHVRACVRACVFMYIWDISLSTTNTGRSDSGIGMCNTLDSMCIVYRADSF